MRRWDTRKKLVSTLIEGCKNDSTPEMEIQLRHITTADSTADGRTVRVRYFENLGQVRSCSSRRIGLFQPLLNLSHADSPFLPQPNLRPAHALNLCPTIIQLPCLFVGSVPEPHYPRHLSPFSIPTLPLMMWVDDVESARPLNIS